MKFYVLCNGHLIANWIVAGTFRQKKNEKSHVFFTLHDNALAIYFQLNTIFIYFPVAGTRRRCTNYEFMDETFFIFFCFSFPEKVISNYHFMCTQIAMANYAFRQWILFFFFQIFCFKMLNEASSNINYPWNTNIAL